MYPYLLVICPYLLLALLIAYHGLKRIRAISYSRLSSNNNIADEKTGPVQGPLPGDSPAYYTGDPSNDVLEIESFDLVPNPPIMYVVFQQVMCCFQSSEAVTCQKLLSRLVTDIGVQGLQATARGQYQARPRPRSAALYVPLHQWAQSWHYAGPTMCEWAPGHHSGWEGIIEGPGTEEGKSDDGLC